MFVLRFNLTFCYLLSTAIINIIIGWDVGHGEESQHAIPVHLFPKHVMDLHMNGEVGFAKEYEEIRAASCLGKSRQLLAVMPAVYQARDEPAHERRSWVCQGV
jgi:hypothetical protein